PARQRAPEEERNAARELRQVALHRGVHDRNAIRARAVDAVGAQHGALDRHGGVLVDEALHAVGHARSEGATLGYDVLVDRQTHRAHLYAPPLVCATRAAQYTSPS